MEIDKKLELENVDAKLDTLMQTTKENFNIIESIKALNAANETVKALIVTQ